MTQRVNGWYRSNIPNWVHLLQYWKDNEWILVGNSTLRSQEIILGTYLSNMSIELQDFYAPIGKQLISIINEVQQNLNKASSVEEGEHYCCFFLPSSINKEYISQDSFQLYRAESPILIVDEYYLELL